MTEWRWTAIVKCASTFFTLLLLLLFLFVRTTVTTTVRDQKAL